MWQQHGDIERGAVRAVVVEELAAAETTHRRHCVPDHDPRSLFAHSPDHTSVSQVPVRTCANALEHFRSANFVSSKLDFSEPADEYVGRST